MLYCYDNALADDLRKCIDSSSGANTIIKVMEPDGILPLVAQMQEDRIEFPLICMFRNQDISIDTERANFTRMHKGVPVVYDNEENNIYFEKSIPIALGYTLNILATNTVDMDEITKEIMFRYTNAYFIPMDLPYESSRIIRFGVRIVPGSVKKSSGALEYIQSGTLYQTSMELAIDGAVMLSYTPRHATRFSVDGVEVDGVSLKVLKP